MDFSVRTCPDKLPVSKIIHAQQEEPERHTRFVGRPELIVFDHP